MVRLPKANKNLGQHFLVSEKVIEAIVSDYANKAGSIIEVGPGPAVLTASLSTLKLPYHVIEKDQRFLEELEKYLPRENIHLEDALEIDYEAMISSFGLKGPCWLVSNLPYNISVPLSLRFLRTPSIQLMTLMMQKEVAEKMCSPAERLNKNRGSLMALMQNYFQIRPLVKVPPGSFFPPPKVDSLVLTFERIESPRISLDLFEQFEAFLRLLFSQRRKQLGKVLKSVMGEIILKELIKHSIDPTRRAESLNLTELQDFFLGTVEKEIVWPLR